MLYTLADLLALGSINCILIVGLNLQYGFSGILNVTYYSFVAIGAYVTAVTTSGPVPSGEQGLVHYVLQWSLPWPVGVLLGGLAAAVLGLVVGVVALRRLRSDYLAIVMIAFGYVIWTIVTNDQNLFNGADGMYGVPPIAQTATTIGYTLTVFGIALALLLIASLTSRRVFLSPYGRVLRSIREDEVVAASAGKSVFWSRMWAALLGCFIGGAGGGILVLYIGAFNPSGFLPIETFVLLAAIIIGGTGSTLGSIVGTLLIVQFTDEVSRLLPTFGNADIRGAGRIVFIGIVLILMIRYRPGGLIPEKIRFYRKYSRQTGPRQVPRRTRVAAPESPEAGGLAVNEVDPAVRSDGQHDGHVQHDRGSDTLDHVTRELTVHPVPSRPLFGGPALAVENVTVSYGGVRALDDCSLSLAGGAVTALIGPNGAGKSTLVEVISGGKKIDSGRILLEDRDITGSDRTAVARLGIIRTFQISRYLARLPVIENLMLAGTNQTGENVLRAVLMRRTWIDQDLDLYNRARDMLDWLGLAALWEAPAASLSGGQRRLLEIGRALMSSPKVLLLDEPTAGLFPAMAAQIIAKVRALPQAGVSVLLIEHDMKVIKEACDDVIVMNLGKVLARGQMETVSTSPEVVDAYLGA